MNKPKVIAVIGTTASGKTSTAIKLAKEFHGEVISCDSRQVYRKLNIGTAKVTKEEMLDIQHHLLDVVDVTNVYTAANFKDDATQTIVNINDRGNLPIVAGGTYFYLDQLRGRNQGPTVPENKALRATLEEKSTEKLFSELQTKDPRRAAVIDRNNRRRLIRSLEIVDAIGSVPPVKKTDSQYDWLIIGLDVPKEVLLERYRSRAEHWIKSGIVDETKWLLQKVSSERFREFGFEYSVTKAFIDGDLSEPELKEKYVQKNWQYAKRQLTWLKRDEEIEWFAPTDLKKISHRVKEFLLES